MAFLQRVTQKFTTVLALIIFAGVHDQMSLLEYWVAIACVVVIFGCAMWELIVGNRQG